MIHFLHLFIHPSLGLFWNTYVCKALGLARHTCLAISFPKFRYEKLFIILRLFQVTDVMGSAVNGKF